MSLKLMYITNRPQIAQIAEASGVDRIFVDLEHIGKSDRQGGMDTVQSRHTLQDVKRVAEAIDSAELLVRVNPIHDTTAEYGSSEEEISEAIANGADIIMLPFFKTAGEVKRFLSAVDGQAKTMLLLETPEAVEMADEVLSLDGIDFIHIGLNDLSLGYGMKFMFELLADGTVERLCRKFKDRHITYGFGGIASIGKGAVPAEMIIREHYRLGSTCAILSRSFCNVDKIDDVEVIRATFTEGIRNIRQCEAECRDGLCDFAKNKENIQRAVAEIIAT